jgi:hypothetical protein
MRFLCNEDKIKAVRDERVETMRSSDAAQTDTTAPANTSTAPANTSTAPANTSTALANTAPYSSISCELVGSAQDALPSTSTDSSAFATSDEILIPGLDTNSLISFQDEDDSKTCSSPLFLQSPSRSSSLGASTPEDSLLPPSSSRSVSSNMEDRFSTASTSPFREPTSEPMTIPLSSSPNSIPDLPDAPADSGALSTASMDSVIPGAEINNALLGTCLPADPFFDTVDGQFPNFNHPNAGFSWAGSNQTDLLTLHDAQSVDVHGAQSSSGHDILQLSSQEGAGQYVTVTERGDNLDSGLAMLPNSQSFNGHDCDEVAIPFVAPQGPLSSKPQPIDYDEQEQSGLIEPAWMDEILRSYLGQPSSLHHTPHSEASLSNLSLGLQSTSQTVALDYTTSQDATCVSLTSVAQFTDHDKQEQHGSQIDFSQIDFSQIDFSWVDDFLASSANDLSHNLAMDSTASQDSHASLLSQSTSSTSQNVAMDSAASLGSQSASSTSQNVAMDSAASLGSQSASSTSQNIAMDSAASQDSHTSLLRLGSQPDLSEAPLASRLVNQQSLQSPSPPINPEFPTMYADLASSNFDYPIPSYGGSFPSFSSLAPGRVAPTHDNSGKATQLTSIQPNDREGSVSTPAKEVTVTQKKATQEATQEGAKEKVTQEAATQEGKVDAVKPRLQKKRKEKDEPDPNLEVQGKRARVISAKALQMIQEQKEKKIQAESRKGKQTK